MSKTDQQRHGPRCTVDAMWHLLGHFVMQQRHVAAVRDNLHCQGKRQSYEATQQWSGEAKGPWGRACLVLAVGALRGWLQLRHIVHEHADHKMGSKGVQRQSVGEPINAPQARWWAW